MTGGVIEVKGPSMELPVTLRYMRQLDVDWSRFSKYGGCLDAYFARTEIYTKSFTLPRQSNRVREKRRIFHERTLAVY